MKIVVIGGTGLIGRQLVEWLTGSGYTAVAAAPSTGVDAVTGRGLTDALDGAGVVVDVSNSPSFEDEPALAFFETSTRNLLAAEVSAGVGHHVALSVVGTAELANETGYFRAKLSQEELIAASPIPYSIVHATQFFEFIEGIAAAATDGDITRLPPVFIQPIASSDVVAAVAMTAIGTPLNGILEVGGPERFRIPELVGEAFAARSDARTVIADPQARYFGARLGEHTLTPGDGATLFTTRFEDWLHQIAAAT